MVLLALFCIAHPSFGHEGHDHDGARVALTAAIYPPVTAKSELYELMGILKDGRLSIYLDRASTNETVRDAQLKVTIGDRDPVDAEVGENATYSVPFPTSGAPELFEVIFTVSAADGDDLLVGPMKLPQLVSSEPVADSHEISTVDLHDVRM